MLGIKKINPIIEDITNETKNKEKTNKNIIETKRKQTPENTSNIFKMKEFKKTKTFTKENNEKIEKTNKRRSQIIEERNSLMDNILHPIIEEEDHSSSSSSEEDEIKKNMENNLNNQNKKYNEEKRKIHHQKKNSFSQSELVKQDIQDLLYFEKKNLLKKNETKTIPLKKPHKVEFSPKITAISEFQENSFTKIEEVDINFNENHKNSIFKQFQSTKQLQKVDKDFELMKDKQLHRIMTINPDKEIELAFYLEKTMGMPIGIYYICGSISSLGEWDTKNALRMKTVKRNGKKFYFNSLKLKKNNFPFQYKFFAKSRGEIIWIGKAFDNYIASEEVFTFISEMKFKKNSILLFNTFSTSEKVNYNNSFSNRKDFIIPFLFKAGSDIILFQDMNKIKYNYIHHRIDAIYEFIGFDRDEAEDIQYNFIAYNKNKYTLNDWGMFWLSSTPGVPGSNDFNNIYPKNCIWASIKKIDDYSCLYFNVEFDKNNYKNYSAMFKVLLQQIKKIMNKRKEDYFVFLGGSFYIKDNDPLFEEIIKFGFKNIDFQNNDD